MTYKDAYLVVKELSPTANKLVYLEQILGMLGDADQKLADFMARKASLEEDIKALQESLSKVEEQHKAAKAALDQDLESQRGKGQAMLDNLISNIAAKQKDLSDMSASYEKQRSEQTRLLFEAQSQRQMEIARLDKEIEDRKAALKSILEGVKRTVAALPLEQEQ